MVNLFVPDEIVTAAKLNAALMPVVHGRSQQFTDNTISTTETVENTAALTIPAAWLGYDVEALCTTDLFESGTLTAIRVVTLRLRLGSLVGTTFGQSSPEVGTADPNRESTAVLGWITGQTTTGVVNVVFTTQIPADTGQASISNTTLIAPSVEDQLMAEMPDVIGGEIVSSDWGNDVRDRSLQRYANGAERTALVPTPAAGDFAFMEDSGIVHVYYSGAWQPVGGSEELNVSQAATTPVALNTVLTARLSVSVPIPAHWQTWEAHAQAMGSYNVGGGSVTMGIRIDGVDSALTEFNFTPDGNSMPFAVQGRQVGFSATGSRTISLMVAVSVAGSKTIDDTILYARAVRTS